MSAFGRILDAWGRLRDGAAFTAVYSAGSAVVSLRPQERAELREILRQAKRAEVLERGLGLLRNLEPKNPTSVAGLVSAVLEEASRV